MNAPSSASGQDPISAGDWELSHLGVAARSLDEVIDTFGTIWGSAGTGIEINHDWACPAAPGGVKRIRGRNRWLVDASPLIEVLESDPESPWVLPDGVAHALDHVAYWVDDLTASAAKLNEHGFTLEYTHAHDKPGTLIGFAYLRSPAGVRIELMPTSDKPAISRWLAGGELKLDWGF
jgi:hypothetical protein